MLDSWTAGWMIEKGNGYGRYDGSESCLRIRYIWGNAPSCEIPQFEINYTVVVSVIIYNDNPMMVQKAAFVEQSLLQSRRYIIWII